VSPAPPEGEGPAQVAPPAEAPPPPPGRLARLRRLLPYATLAWAITSALIMNRKPERAWLVAVAVGLGWLFLAGTIVMGRRTAGQDAAEATRAQRLAQFTATAATQSLMQLTLFFVLPFYWLSSAPVLGHRVFLGLIAFVAALTLWDPLFVRVFKHPFAALPLKAITSFVGLFAALPFLGLSHRASLWVAAGVTAAGVPLVAVATSALENRRRALRAGLLAAGLVPAAVGLGAVEWIPPAPLRLPEAGLGTGIDRDARVLLGAAASFPAGRTDRLHCFTAIYAPLGLHEQVFHVWTRDLAPLYRATLDVGGNRKGAWRTWSNVSAQKPGHYRCDVVTSTGQILGRLEADVR
jgi:hypothetical protein